MGWLVSFPDLRLDQSSPAKSTATRMIAVTIPRRETRSWSYSGLRHLRLQPQTQMRALSPSLEGASRPQELSLRSISIMCRGRKSLGNPYQRASKQVLLTCGIGTKPLPRLASKSPSHYGPRANLEQLGPAGMGALRLRLHGHLGSASYTSSSPTKKSYRSKVCLFLACLHRPRYQRHQCQSSSLECHDSCHSLRMPRNLVGDFRVNEDLWCRI